MMKKYFFTFTLILFLPIQLTFAQSQQINPFIGDALVGEEDIPPSSNTRIDVHSIRAMEQFSWGLRAFHEGLYNKALLDFENAVHLKPTDPLYQLWLGNANFATGLNDLAIRQWQGVINNNHIGGGWLRNRIETLFFRNSPYQDNTEQDIWTVRHELSGKSEHAIRFNGPTDLAVDPLGTKTYVAGYLSNNIAVFDVNGSLRNRFNGGIMQLDGPWGVLAMNDGNLFVTEFRGRRVTLLNPNGHRLLSFGNTPDDGNLLGPQYMSSTEDGYLYVSDWVGNKVVKYDFNGKYIMTIGLPSSNFSGIKQPSGLATTLTELFVVDTKDKIIHVFDHFGNHIRSFGKGKLEQPENIKILANSHLLIADGKRVLSYNIHNDSITETTNLNGKAQRVVSVDLDRNGTVVVADQVLNSLTFLVPRSELYGGFFLNIHRVVNDNFPLVSLIANVQSRQGQPILGLEQENFFVQENGLPLDLISVENLDIRQNGSLASVIMIENSDLASKQKDLILHAVQNITQNLTSSDLVSIIWTGEQPVHTSVHSVQEASAQFYSLFDKLIHRNWRFDRGLRLAGSQLINSNARLSIFFITTGTETRNANQYSFLDLSNYLKNNNIAFYPIYLKQGISNKIYNTIAKETGGQSFYVLRPRGLKEVVNIARNRPTGMYKISYHSPTEHNHGKDYIYLTLMSAIQSQSGLTQSGYFSPITLSKRLN